MAKVEALLHVGVYITFEEIFNTEEKKERIEYIKFFSKDKVLYLLSLINAHPKLNSILNQNDYESQIKKGDNLVFAAFGGGFTWGSIYLKWAYN